MDLRRHIDDRRLAAPGAYASWPVVGHASAVPYRAFRVLLIGPNPEAQNPRHVCLSYVELYGYFYRDAGGSGGRGSGGGGSGGGAAG